MTVVTLTTDLGTSSPAVGLLSGVIWGHAPGAQIVDLTHDLAPRDLRSAQVVLENALPYFPQGTIHLASLSNFTEAMRILVAQLGGMLFVGPDNGLITPLLEWAEANRWPVEIIHANRPQYWPADPKAPPHLVYAALVGHLANGVPPTELGERISDPMRDSIPAPEMTVNGWRGLVVQIDHFGNLAANIKSAHLEGMGRIQVVVSGIVIEGLSRTFGESQPGDLIAMLDSSNHLSICVVNGSAAERLNAHAGDSVEVRPASAAAA